jgi:hypothetical protein
MIKKILLLMIITLFTMSFVFASSHTFTIECSDGDDNDGDGLIDLADPDCSSSSDNKEGHGTQCNDGRDNDGDGLIDYDPFATISTPDDPGCSSEFDNVEEDAAFECNDGEDNDGLHGTDFLGACIFENSFGEIDTFSCSENGFDTQLGCFMACGVLGKLGSHFPDVVSSTYIVPDPQCRSIEDNTEEVDVDYGAVLTVGSHLEIIYDQTTCSDGLDNNFDGKYDAIGSCQVEYDGIVKDFACVRAGLKTSEDCKAACETVIPALIERTYGYTVPATYIEGDELCTSLEDNKEVAPQCSDGIDNDGDYLTGGVDYLGICRIVGGDDLSCSGMGAETQFGCGIICEGHFGGTYVRPDFNCDSPEDDTEDNSPEDPTHPFADSTCNDGLDNDGDGTTDNIGACSLTASPFFNPREVYTRDFSCSDFGFRTAEDCQLACTIFSRAYGLSRGGNLILGAYTPGDDQCLSPEDNTELNIGGGVDVATTYTEVIIANCDDGVDNDGDGYTDSEDAACTLGTSEYNRCGDGWDNNGNGRTDYYGGCDTNSDNLLDYRCGCDSGADNLLQTSESLEGHTATTCSEAGFDWGCVPLANNPSYDGTLDFTIHTDCSDATWFAPDAQCSELGDDSEKEDGLQIANVGTTIFSAPQAKEGFFKSIISFIFG